MFLIKLLKHSENATLTSSNHGFGNAAADERNIASGQICTENLSRDYVTKKYFLQLLRIGDEIVQGTGRKGGESIISWCEQSERSVYFFIFQR
jgi:hypothetical protein